MMRINKKCDVPENKICEVENCNNKATIRIYVVNDKDMWNYVCSEHYKMLLKGIALLFKSK